MQRCKLLADTLVVDGKQYTPKTVDTLPHGLRQETHTQHSGQFTFFFGKRSELTNVHPCSFKLDGQIFTSVEQRYQAARTEYHYQEELAVRMKSINNPRAIKQMSHKIRRNEENPDMAESCRENNAQSCNGQIHTKPGACFLSS